MKIDSQNIKYRAQNFPAPRPAWEQNRTYEEYIKLLSPQKEHLKFIDFTLLPLQSRLLDIGFGEGHFLNHIKKVRPDIETIGVAVSNCKKSLYKNIDNIYIQKIPEDLTLLSANFEKMDVVIDVFGAATYATNPLHALIYSAFLVKPQGYYFSISSLIPDSENISCFGDKSTRTEIQHFFQFQLGIPLFFEEKEVKSKLELLIYFQKLEKQSAWTLHDYHELIKSADKIIGTPIERSSWKPFTGKFRIISYEYIKPEFSSMLA